MWKEGHLITGVPGNRASLVPWLLDPSILDAILVYQERKKRKMGENRGGRGGRNPLFEGRGGHDLHFSPFLLSYTSFRPLSSFLFSPEIALSPHRPGAGFALLDRQPG